MSKKAGSASRCQTVSWLLFGSLSFRRHWEISLSRVAWLTWVSSWNPWLVVSWMLFNLLVSDGNPVYGWRGTVGNAKQNSSLKLVYRWSGMLKTSIKKYFCQLRVFCQLLSFGDSEFWTEKNAKILYPTLYWKCSSPSIILVVLSCIFFEQCDTVFGSWSELCTVFPMGMHHKEGSLLLIAGTIETIKFSARSPYITGAISCCPRVIPVLSNLCTGNINLVSWKCGVLARMI